MYDERIKKRKYTIASIIKNLRIYFFVGGLINAEHVYQIYAQPNFTQKKEAQPVVKSLDGRRVFDFETGTWKTHLKRLVKPLTSSNDWVKYDGTTEVRKVWNGRANLVELVADSPAGHFEGLSLRL